MKSTFISILCACFSMVYAQEADPETIKVALRHVGHTLLLQNRDSTSLVSPIDHPEQNKFVLSFENAVEIEPDSLVLAIKKSFSLAGLPNTYIVEVLGQNANRVVYSYQIKGTKEKDIIPCLGRNLPKDRYIIQVIFSKKSMFNTAYIGIVGLLLFCVAGFYFYFNKKRGNRKYSVWDETALKFGEYHFLEHQNKMVKKNKEIKLTPKETQILQIFIANPNMVIKRERLVKEVWEDNGVVVGRSLDAFISKIRKKFEGDDSIHIVNVHGVGYKFEILAKK